MEYDYAVQHSLDREPGPGSWTTAAGFKYPSHAKLFLAAILDRPKRESGWMGHFRAVKVIRSERWEVLE